MKERKKTKIFYLKNNMPPEDFQASSQKKSVLFFIFFLILILFFGCCITLATRLWDPFWNPFRPKPEKVMAIMINQMKKVNSYHGKMDLALKLTNQTQGEMILNVESREDKTFPEKPKIGQKFDLSISFSEKNAPAGMGIKFAFGGEIRKLGEKTYLKLTTLPQIPFLKEVPELNRIISMVKDQWIKTDKESIEGFLKEMPFEEEIKEEMLKEVEEREEKEKALQKELQEKIERIISKRKFYLIKKQFPDEKIDGVKVYHYLVSLNQKELSKMFAEIFKVLEETMIKEYGLSLSAEKENIEKAVADFLEKIGEIEGEVWIGKKDYLLYRLKGEKSFDLSKFEENKEGKFLVRVSLENSQFNKPLQIEEPSEAKELKEIFGPFFEMYSQFLTKSQPKGAEEIISNMRRLGLMAEFFYSYEEGYQSLCHNQKLNVNHPLYGANLKEIEEKIKKIQGGKLNLFCYSAKNSYCIVVDLPFPEKGKYCIDSGGFMGEIEENLGCLGKGTLKESYRCPQRLLKRSSRFQLPAKEIPSFFQASLLETILKLLKK